MKFTGYKCDVCHGWIEKGYSILGNIFVIDDGEDRGGIVGNNFVFQDDNPEGNIEKVKESHFHVDCLQKILDEPHGLTK